jgi:hypothetical protein
MKRFKEYIEEDPVKKITSGEYAGRWMVKYIWNRKKETGIFDNKKDAIKHAQVIRKTKGAKLDEDVSKSDLNQIEKYADKLFAAVGIDVEFTRHFLDRVNDDRNEKPINTAELIRLFRLTYKKYGKKIAKMNPDAEAVIHDMETDVNMPFVLNLDKNGMLDLVAKTVMRKKDFKTSNQKLEV